MDCSSKDSCLYASCCCQNMVCGIVLLVLGAALGITGCVVAAVGFGRPPEDMFDYPNLAMRVSGLVMVGIAILPIALSICCWVFYCSSRRQKRKQPSKKACPDTSPEQVQMTMAEYPYPEDSGNNRIYRPPQPPGYTPSYGGSNTDDTSIPLKFSSSSGMPSFDQPYAIQHAKKGKKLSKQRATVVDEEEEAVVSGGQSTLTSTGYGSDPTA